MRLSSIGAAVVSSVAFWVTTASAGIGPLVPFPANEPLAQGDQIISYYDARDGYTTFLTVRHAFSSFDTLTIRLTFFSGGFSVPFTQDITLANGALRVIDVGALREDGLAAQPGVVMANAIDAEEQPIVTRAMTGNFTVANLTTGAGWGAPAAARNAFEADLPKKVLSLPSQIEGPHGILLNIPELGTPIDGFTVSLQPIQPQELDLAAYYDPDDLAPPEDGGNQLIFISFADVIGSTYDAAAQSTQWGVDVVRNDGTGIGETTFGASGVVVTDLESVAGPAVNGASGSIRFETDLQFGEPVSRFIFFAEALGTFGTGYRLPALEPPPLL